MLTTMFQEAARERFAQGDPDFVSESLRLKRYPKRCSNDRLSEILDGRVWQSGCIMPYREKELERLGINVIVNLYGDAPVERRPRYPLTEITWPIFDAELRMVNLHALHALGRRIASGIENHGDRVLIHCQEGLNRSGLLVGIVLRELGVEGDIVSLIRRRRDPLALCNREFAMYVTRLPAAPVHRGRRYLKSFETAPSGSIEFRGPRGGRYYEVVGAGGGSR